MRPRCTEVLPQGMGLGASIIGATSQVTAKILTSLLIIQSEQKEQGDAR